ncbi:hypothetical protein [Pseudonocardia nigra]|uniref:hypothetical protein n=1 Tax=Pseudonocardia nigra TaxID=1921578 RepID=UPI001C5EA7A1|nr:hypothetical protein [Pseudonocardia nigra]
MSSPDYPLLVLPSYEMYQIAHIATFLAEGLARHRAAGSREERWNALRDLAGGRAALDQALGVTGPSRPEDLPCPIDTGTYRAAREIMSAGPRQAEVVSLESTGRRGWAVVGQVPGIGPVGAVVSSKAVADALRHHVLTQPVQELTAWAVRDRPARLPTLSQRVDLAAFVENLNPTLNRSRAVARHLRGLNSRVDAAIRGRFAGVDLDGPLVVEPPQAPARATGPARPQRSAPASRHLCGIGPQVTTHSAPKVPANNAGP